jgi:hypothetical protein
VTSALTSSEFLKSIGLGIVCSVVASAVVLNMSRNGAEFPLGYVLIIGILQVSMAVVAIPREVLYWSRFLERILGIEILFWVLFLAAALCSWVLDLSVMTVLGIVAFCVVLRLGLYIALGAQKDVLSHSLE